MQFCRCRHFKGFIFRLDYGKKRGCTREEKEKERLKHKYKKEFKGALRELRKDSRFLAREKLNEVVQRCERKTVNILVKTAKWKLLNFVLSLCCRDTERKKKVKELFGSLASQEGEWKALKRKKRK